MSAVKGLRPKLAAIQRNSRPVELKDASDGDASFEFMPADKVFEEVRRLHRYYSVGYLVESIDSDPGPPVRARVTVTLFDAKNPDDSEALEWEGEAGTEDKRPYGSARTNALKAFFVAQYRIPAAQKPAENRREARQQAARRATKLATKAQREHRILVPARERGLGEEAVLALANDLLGENNSIDDLADLPEVWVDPLRDEILKLPEKGATT